MKAYLALFRIRFINSLQYRLAALAGVVVSFAWGVMSILAYAAFYRADPAAFPMEFPHLVSYIWMHEALLLLFSPWGGTSDAVESIVSGNIAYELARPMDIYDRWFVEAAANKVAKTALRCVPILIIAFLLPPPYGMAIQASLFQLSMFVLSVPLCLGVTTAYCMLDNISTFHTMSRSNVIFVIVADFFAGAYIPLPFFPEPLRKIVELTPFAAMQNMPLRIFSGDIAGAEALRGVALQVFWLAALLVAGKLLMRNSLRRVVSQGG